MHTLWLLIAAILAIGTGFAGAASAENEGSSRVVEEAIADANAGRCDEAFSALAGSGELESRARLLVAQCQIRAGRYPEALNELDRIRGASDLTATQVGDVELYRAVAFYHLERYAEASAALGRADGLSEEEAQLALYSGLIALRNGDNDRAAPALETAARLSPAVTEPVASYYAGLAWQGSAERLKARAAFKRVVEIDGDGPWGKEAAKMLEASAPYPFYVHMSVGIESDDNVQLRGGVTQFGPAGTTLVATDGEKDWRGVWRVNAGVQLFEAQDWSGGITGGYSGTAHHDLDDFDTHYPTIGAYLAHRFDPNTTGQVRYQYGFAWVDEEKFIQSQVINVSLAHNWAKVGTTLLSTDLLWTDLRFRLLEIPDAPVPPIAGGCTGAPSTGCGPSGVREDRERDRDGIGFGIGVSHNYPLSVPDALDRVFKEVDLSGGYRFVFFDSDGTEWKYMAHVFDVGLDVELPLGFRASTHVLYEFRDFAHPSTFPDREVADVPYALSSADREEHEIRIVSEIEKDLTEHLSVSARWSYVDSESNRRVYDYTRHIVGGYLNFRFD